MEEAISLLPVEIIASESSANETRIVSVGDLQSKGKQSIVIVAGFKSYVKDAIITAKLETADLFISKNIYVIPVVYEEAADGGVGVDRSFYEGASKGFGAKDELMSAAYIGRPTQVR